MSGRLLQLKAIMAEAFLNEKTISSIILQPNCTELTIGENAFTGCINCTVYMTQKLYDYLISQGRITTNRIDDASISIYEETPVVISLTQSSTSALTYIDEETGVTYNYNATNNNVTIKKAPTTLTAYPKLESINLNVVLVPKDKNATPITVSITGIEESAFENCNQLVLSRVPDSISSIGTSAFDGCSKLTLKNLPGELKTLGVSSFSDCTVLPLSLIRIDTIRNYSFRNCKGIQSLSTTATNIGKYAFENCTSLKSVEILKDTLGFIENVSIGENAFNGCTGLEKVDFSMISSFSVIGENAFSSCVNCEIIFSSEAYNQLKEMGRISSTGYLDNAKASIDNIILLNTEYHDSVYNVTYTPLSELDKTLELTSVLSKSLLEYPPLNTATPDIERENLQGIITTGYKLISIGANAFENQNTFKIQTLPDSIISIGDYAFNNNEALNLSQFPESLVSVGSYAFANDIALATTNFKNISKIGSHAFENCSLITGFQLNIESLEDFAFHNCNALDINNITLKNNSIGISTFENCTSITNLSFSFENNTDVVIGESAFNGCTNLQTVDFTGIQSFKDNTIGVNAFRGCSQCTVYFTPEVYNALRNSGRITGNYLDDATVRADAFIRLTSNYYDAERKMEYALISSESKELSLINVQEKTEVFELPSPTLYSVTNEAGEVIYGYTLKKIGASLYKDNKVIKKVTIPDGVTIINYQAFYQSSLEEIILPDSLQELVGSQVFSGTKLRTISIGKNVTSIGAYAFSDNDLLTSADFSEAVNLLSFSDYLLRNCSSLTEIIFPPNLQHLGYESISYTPLTSITLPDSLLTMDIGALSENKSLQSITIPPKVKIIPRSCFEGCNALTTVNLSGSVEELKMNAFNTDSNGTLTSVNLPTENNLSIIGYGSFAHAGITTLQNLKKVTTIDTNAFYGCSSLQTLDLSLCPLLTIGSGAFFDCTQCTITLNLAQYNDLVAKGRIVENKIDDATVHTVDAIVLDDTLKDVVTEAQYEIIDYDARTLRLVSVPDTVTEYVTFDKEVPIIIYDGYNNWKIIEIGVVDYMIQPPSVIPENMSLSKIPLSIQKMGSSALSGNNYIQSIIANNVSELGVTSLYNLKQCISIETSASIFGFGAINNCKLLKTLILNATSMYFKNYSINFGYHFRDLVALEHIYCPNLTSAWVFEGDARKGLFQNITQTVTIHVPDGILQAFKDARVCDDSGHIIGGVSGTTVMNNITVVEGGFPEEPTP